jgi:ATP-dependent RNA helicase DDX54/DBP10
MAPRKRAPDSLAAAAVDDVPAEALDSDYDDDEDVGFGSSSEYSRAAAKTRLAASIGDAFSSARRAGGRALEFEPPAAVRGRVGQPRRRNSDGGDAAEGSSGEAEEEEAEEEEAEEEQAEEDVDGQSAGAAARARKRARAKEKRLGGFAGLGLLEPVARAVLKEGFRTPTPIQRSAIPLVMAGRDVVAMARTGSGKTAAFLLPILSRLESHSSTFGARALVLSPTRELAMQTYQFCRRFARFTDLRVALLVGGEGMEAQFLDLSRNPDVIVATPGRLSHHLVEVGMSLKSVQFAVFDEADRLFEDGYEEQLRSILGMMAPSRQTLLFSATLPAQIVEFTRAGLNNPELVRLDSEMRLSEDLRRVFLAVRHADKAAALLALLKEPVLRPDDHSTVIFAATKLHVDWLLRVLQGQGLSATCIYGDMDQSARKINLARFRAKRVRFLIVTDVAARGIDIPLLDNVINFDFPAQPKLFVHRAGRVARAGRTGTAYSFVSPEEMPYLLDLLLFLGEKATVELPAPKAGGAAPLLSNSFIGAIPPLVIDRESESLRKQLDVDASVASATKAAENAYKNYRRTRRPPSAASVKRAKEFDVPPLHPEFSDEGGALGTPAAAGASASDLLAQLRDFRPKVTALELQRGDAGRATQRTADGARQALRTAIDAKPLPGERLESRGVRIMAHMRAQNERALERTKKKRLERALAPAAIHSSDDDDDNDDYASGGDGAEAALAAAATASAAAAAAADGSGEAAKKSFRDPQFFMSSFPRNMHTEQGLSLQRSAMDAATLEVNADAARSTRGVSAGGGGGLKWDRKKKRFVNATAAAAAVASGVADDDSGSGGKRRRVVTESGQVISQSYKTGKYEEWLKKNKIRIPVAGEEEEAKAVAAIDEQLRNQRRFKHHLAATGGASAAAKGRAPRGADASTDGTGVRSAEQVRAHARAEIKKRERGGKPKRISREERDAFLRSRVEARSKPAYTRSIAIVSHRKKGR